jgi:hypothetical protein
MDIRRSLYLTIALVTLVLVAGVLPKPAAAQAPTVVLASQAFEIVAHKPDLRHGEMTYCAGDDIYFVFEPGTQYSPNEYLRFYYLDEHKAIAHDEARLSNLTVVTDAKVSAPMARLVGLERGENVWDIIVTTDMRKAYSGCLSKLKSR